MIVDDEFIMRIGIKSMINWEDNGYQIVGEASDGQDAIGKIGALEPDIILTDLVMEPMDGLELIRYCAKYYPRISMVVLSNYDDFANVKAAMKLGAKDYLLKLTTQPEQLLSILNEVSGEIDSREEGDQEIKGLIHHSSALLRQRVLRMMMDFASAPRADEIRRDLRKLGGDFDPDKPYALLYLSIANFFLLDSNGEGTTDNLFSGTLESAIDEIVREDFPAQVFRLEKGVYPVVINLAGRSDPRELRQRLEGCFKQINTCVERYFGVCITGCVSAPLFGIQAFAGAAERCALLMHNRFTLRKNRLLREEDRAHSWIAPPELPLADWQISLECFDFEQSRAFLVRTLNPIYDRPMQERAVRERLYELYRIWKLDAAEKGIPLETCVDQCGQTLYQAIFHYDLLSAIERSFHDVLDLYERRCMEICAHSPNRDIAEIQIYVRKHLSENISTAAAAKVLHMSESYFSRLFRRETGQRFVDYVNRLRIEQSKALLTHTDKKISEVAAEVGIENANYFSTLFRKLTGLSPMEFRMEGARHDDR